MKKLILLSILFSSSASAEGVNPAIVAEMSARLTSIEEQNRQLTGRIEELEYQTKQLEAKLNAAQAAAPVEAPTPAPAAAQPSAASPASANPYVTKVGENKNPKYTTKAPGDHAMENDFDAAFSNIATEDYATAKPALNSFIKKYPQTDLSGEAYYWLGEVAWSEKDYTNAAINYLKGYKEAPTGGKAGENILKMALTLNELGKKDEVCKYVARFGTEFPNAHPSLKAKANQAKAKIGCK